LDRLAAYFKEGVFDLMTQAQQGLSYIIPAYNEEKSIEDTVRRLRTTLAQIDIPSEIIVVNDGSRDKTKELAQSCNGVRVISHPINIGYGNSLKTGIKHASFEWVGIVDADGSYPIEDIPLLVQAMQEGYDMVVGVRSNINDLDSYGKRVFRGLFKKLVCLLNDSRIEDPNSGLRIFRRDVAIRLFPFLCGTFSFTTSITILTSGLYYFIKYIPIQYSVRTGHSKVRHFRDSLRTFLYIIQGVIFFNPIKFFIILAISMIVLVCFPAMVIAMMRHPTLSLYYMIFGTAVALMIGMGGLGDIIRIAAERKDRNF
jgi:glycosyltransferase involved in cell wall biosynthesis